MSTVAVLYNTHTIKLARASTKHKCWLICLKNQVTMIFVVILITVVASEWVSARVRQAVL